MDTRGLVREIQQEFEKKADVKYRASIMRFFREPVDLHGVRTPAFRAIAQASYARIPIQNGSADVPNLALHGLAQVGFRF